jgi:hypothetical protein
MLQKKKKPSQEPSTSEKAFYGMGSNFDITEIT